jgi:MFS family permease
MKQEALWTRNFTLAFIINFLLAIVFYLLMTSMAPYAIDRFGASSGTAGLTTGIYLVGLMSGRLLIGRFIDQLGARKILIICTVVNLAVCAFYLVASALPLLIANRLVHGVTAAMCSTTTATLIAQMVPAHRRGEGIGFYSLSVILGSALGPFVAVPLIQQLQYDVILWLSVASTALSAVMSCLLAPTQARPAAPAQAPATTGAGARARLRLDGFIDMSVLPIAMVGVVIALSFSGLVAFLSLYCADIGLTGPAGWFFLVYSIAILVSRPFSGRLLDTKGANIVVYPTLIVYAVGMLLFSQADSGSVLLISAAIIGFGYGNYQSSGQALAVKAVPPARLGIAMSTYMFFYDFGYGLGPYLSGLIAPYTGYRGLYVITVGVILAALAMYHVLYGRRVIIE